jgi:hypothetical protein
MNNKTFVWACDLEKFRGEGVLAWSFIFKLIYFTKKKNKFYEIESFKKLFIVKNDKYISKKNTVIVSSHSIFMIDKERVDRHLIVKKNDEVTQVTIGSVSDILDEEVIYRALGFSLVDLLKQNNIIFEGWCDKHTFQRWLKSKSVNSNIKNQWKDIGLTHALGEKDIARVAGMLESFGRNYFIITDSDQPSLEWKDKFKGDGEWLTFKDLGF